MDKNTVLRDYRIACESRQLSILGRKEALAGKAKFGIFGDGKELPQLAMSHVFRPGDWRSGYYRDQTFMLAAGLLTLEEFFAQLYGDTDPKINPGTGGRIMNNHFATRSIDDNGNWKDIAHQKNSSADISPTAGQMPRLLGLALASKVYRNVEELRNFTQFSNNGNEIAFGTIGDASTSEGHFFETLNAAGVLQVPMLVSVWDDGYGISVPKKYQTTKESISELLAGFQKTEEKAGFLIFSVKGWDYPALIETYSKAEKECRENHIPVLIHVQELTQPLGHSTSGSHERYKSKERLEWEQEYDGISRMRKWIIETGIAQADELDKIEAEAIESVKEAKKKAWKNLQAPIIQKRNELAAMLGESHCKCPKLDAFAKIRNELLAMQEPLHKDVVATARKILRFMCNRCHPDKPLKKNIQEWLSEYRSNMQYRYSSHLYSEGEKSALNIREIPPVFSENSPWVTGREILNQNYKKLFAKHPQLMIFGEDVGYLGGVNQTTEGLQQLYGEFRVSDTGIREATILGQAIGLALRGLRPIAEIQYFDYLLYALQTLSDDLATLHYRTVGGQIAPVIVSTRGHRLVGIWHSGSALSMVINSIRGVRVCVPRNMTQAAGFYNTALASSDPFLIIEPLNGYRLKEKLPDNIGEYNVPLGKPEILKYGNDVTIVTYGSCVRIAEEAVAQLENAGISCELIDVQTLLPFDIHHVIIQSLQKTNKILFFDEDVPGGTTAFMMQQVLETQGGYRFLDAVPKTLTAKEHRPAYSADGDYFSNPNAEDVFDAVYEIMNEYDPVKFPPLYER